ncbi:unnamed protein product [Trifolium pratense]|uniref:Uncharacterized protein n=1 Tax=Trifolium pratense TaxID=57577 RepID=A0ACB0KMJ1_TRIPR|nr:unnamed protein product [Trifolium pratense]
MEFKQLSCLIVLCLTLIKINASQSGEGYWKSIWPNTPMPKTLLDWQIVSESETTAAIRDQEEKEDWTAFFEHDLYPGKKMTLGVHKPSDRQPLPSKLAQLPIRKTNKHFGSRTQDEVKQPLGTWIWSERHSIESFCATPSAIGEDKYCAPSLKLMMDFAISKLGKNIKVISSSFSQNQDQYMVEEVKKIGDKAVMCHRLNFNKVVFYCHEVNATTTYIVPLVAFDGTKAKALTICHHDTRGMDPKVLHQVLKVKPGTIPICHFIGNKAVAWVPNHVVSEPYDHPCVI